MRSYKLNLVLLFLACIAVFLLIRYTDVANIGIGESLNVGFANIKRIIYAPNPNPELTETEKENLKKTLQETNRQFLFCQSSYFPFVSGAKWRYQLTRGAEKDVVELGVPSGEGNLVYLDGRRLSREKWTIRTILQCVGGRIKTTDLNFLTIFLQDRLVTTPCENGQFNFSLPRDADFVKGNSWAQSGCLVHAQLDQNYQKKESETKENLDVRWKALGTETINLPAGQFPAQKIELDFPDALVNLWIAPEVGIIKTTHQELGAAGGITTQELIEYQIPTEKDNKSRN